MGETLKKPGIFRRALGALARKYRLTDPEFVAKMGGSGTDAGIIVTEQGALNMAAAWCCIRIITESVAMLPLQTFQETKGGSVQQVNDHELGNLLSHTPNADQTPTEFREALVASLCTNGNAYSNKDRRTDGSIIALTPYEDPRQVEPKRNSAGQVVFTAPNSNGAGTKDYTRDEIWQIKGFGHGGLKGLSPIGHARQAIGLGMAAESFGARFFSQGARPTGAFEVPTWIDEKVWPVVKKKLEDAYTGLDNAHKFIVLEGGMKFHPITMPLEDAQFILTRKYQTADICRMYRVPLHMVMEMEGSTNNNIEHQGLSFVVYTLMPYLTRIEDSISRWLLTPKDRAAGIFLRHNVEGLLRADSTARALFYSAMLQNGVYSRNEVRALEKRPRVEGLDDYTVQMNLTPASMLAALAQSNINKGQ